MDKNENTGLTLSQLGCVLLHEAGGDIRVSVADMVKAAEGAGGGDSNTLALLQGADVIWAVSERTGKKLWGFVREPLEDPADNTRPPRILRVALNPRSQDWNELLRVVATLGGEPDPIYFRICKATYYASRPCFDALDPPHDPSRGRDWLVVRLLRANGPCLPVYDHCEGRCRLLHGLDWVAEALSGGRTTRPVYRLLSRSRDLYGLCSQMNSPAEERQPSTP
jgi:hypothetical protein